MGEGRGSRAAARARRLGLEGVAWCASGHRRRYVDDALVRPSVALVDLGVGWGLYDDASPKSQRAVVRSGPALHDVPSNTSTDLSVSLPWTPPTAYRRPLYDATP